MSHGDANAAVTCTGKSNPSQEVKCDSKVCITELNVIMSPGAPEVFCLVGREKSGDKSSEQADNFSGGMRFSQLSLTKVDRHLQEVKTLNSSPWCSYFHRLLSKTLD